MVLGHTALSNRPQYHAQTAIITRLTRILSDGAESLNSLQGGSASGSMPRMSPPIATGGNPRLPQQAMRSRGRTTGYAKPSRTTNRHQPVKVMHWNTEGVLNKQTDLQHVLHENNITICCIQETHLQPKKSFKVRGYQCFRSDIIDRSKGRILTLVRNNIDAIQTATHMDDTEFQVLNLKKKDFHMKLVNLYSPNDKALSLNALPAVEDNYLVVGDFNSHSQSWGYDHIDKRGEEVEKLAG